LSQNDQASELRAKVFSEKVVKKDEEMDIFNLPPRSKIHSKKSQEKETIHSGKIHLWVTRSIVFAFICLLIFTVFYFSSSQLNGKFKKDAVNLIDVIR
jgi:hypothetical protein